MLLPFSGSSCPRVVWEAWTWRWGLLASYVDVKIYAVTDGLKDSSDLTTLGNYLQVDKA